MKPDPPWPYAKPRYCRDCFRPVHEGDCDRPFSFPGWEDRPVGRRWKPVEDVETRGGLL